MSALNNRKTATNKVAMSVSDLIVRRSKRKAKAAPMLTEDLVPACKYHSKIIAVTDAKSDEGKLMADVTYRFTDARGKEVDVRIRYPATGYHIDRLYDAMIDAGLPEETPLTEAVGIEERVEVTYPYEGALGKIKDRRPAATTAPAPKPKKRAALIEDEVEIESDEVSEDEDDEFDDFLEDDDF